MWDARDTKEYWEARVRPYLETADPLVSVTSTGLPKFFAHYTDWLERRTLRQALMYLRNKGPFLEVGCGYGRWFEFWGNTGRPFVGMDFTFSLVRRARTKHPEGLWVVADVRHLPFSSGVFGRLCSVKVLQCVPPKDRGQAVAELFRVLSPRGCGVLLEKIRDQDGSLPADWIQWGNANAGELIAWTGNEYAPLDRLVRTLRDVSLRWVRGRKAKRSPSLAPGFSSLARQRWPGLYRVFLAVRQIMAAVSWVIEPLMEKILPPDWAVHGLFVFRKT